MWEIVLFLSFLALVLTGIGLLFKPRSKSRRVHLRDKLGKGSGHEKNEI